MEVRNEECDAMIELFEASRKGCVSTLKTLIEKDPFILNEFSLTSSGRTPLHISVSRGHLDFTKALLERKPELAMELDSRKRLPLHLASAEGHKDIVKELLDANKNANFDRDQYGRIPLHYAAMRGRADVVRELISTRLQYSTQVVLVLDGEERSALHLCVKYNHLEALKVLVDQFVSDESADKEFLLNLKDGDSGNTILHLAVMLKQIETINYLLSIPKIKARADVVNRKGFTASKILKHWPKEDKSLEVIQEILEQNHKPKKPAAHLLLWCEKIIRWFGNLRYQGNWLEDMRGSLMVVATVITTMTFQPSVAPPGGVFSYEDSQKNHSREAGTSVLAETSPFYFRFMLFNTIAFVASLSVVFLLISGFPLKSKYVMWILAFAMFTSLTFTAIAYLYAMYMMIPNTLFSDLVYTVVVFIWIGLVALVLGIHSVRCLTVLVKERPWILGSLKERTSSIRNRFKARKSSTNTNDQP